MTKLKIAENPTFTAEVEIPRVGGDPIKVPFTFRYRDRAALAELFDRWQAENKARYEAVGDGSTLTDITAAEVKQQVAQLAEIVEAWGFDDPLNEDSLRALVLTSIGAGTAVLDAYGAAYRDAHRGN
ncbi:phage tail assembly chaperone [Azotobacter beijerinckii]|uniref:phage tail assembly chaperone n=1 Tax=Azotobacter beijerinckii TaxID=170623 RepID=UPI0029552411|nr:phage tail assembly chaperone [Azotobacter beijerinckii]MDV7209903.1 phage tail assembly chaperone [Azotobacter beijerinckii]